MVIVFNGEIYNFADLRPKLQALGHVFRSDHSDTETILHAWESWGPDCLHRLTGMFAFALWDRGRGQLFLARDRLGEKPLYHATTPDGGFVFGSEMAALAEVAALPRRIAATAVEDFLTWGYIPDPATIYAGIHRLPAAHCAAAANAASPPVLRRYWQPAHRASARRTRPAPSRNCTARLRGRHRRAAGRRRAARRLPVGRRRFQRGRRHRRRGCAPPRSTPSPSASTGPRTKPPTPPWCRSAPARCSTPNAPPRWT